ncbi:Domain of unknown function DUF4338 [Acididesulfobacillus acetoxydans]|uniref:Type I restriction-modification system methyltransferase subunit n=1 Tax=Acididesulfobacillus acetoxydans TaxID=1561005 RepID=A0A8S0X3H3_9FIRM|nr:Druantia anti-phage system protein DruA [Acididesulfobacillus acetoxydans]CAA7600090.1 Domain of unknown function DUF4338 [Acididesulfobacillus acetoxydans]CEJ07666.1 Type I restriction-modification system methyltransferase subunit [Acididesulfobacillus acetoxydans]
MSNIFDFTHGVWRHPYTFAPSSDELRDKIIRELGHVHGITGPPNAPMKNLYREMHYWHRYQELERNKSWIQQSYQRYRSFFACGLGLDPAKVQPELIPVEKGPMADLFRLARYTWQLPYSKGYGRRLRFLLWDRYHDKLMGLIGLQSPPIDLALRDNFYQIPRAQKVVLINQTMDAFVLGAVPPYNGFLGGKLAVMAAASRDVRLAYERKYRLTRSELRQELLPARLVAITTLSAFGRSSLYNRVSAGKTSRGQNHWLTFSLGQTSGWGTYHCSDTLYQELKDFVRAFHPELRVTGFGTGPKIKRTVITLALRALGLPSSLAQHGIPRELFIIPHISNLGDFLGGRRTEPAYNDLSFADLAAHWRNRYLLGLGSTPRYLARSEHWTHWDHDDLRRCLGLS